MKKVKYTFNNQDLQKMIADYFEKIQGKKINWTELEVVSWNLHWGANTGNSEFSVIANVPVE